MQTIKTILLLLLITLQAHSNIPPQITYNENNQLSFVGIAGVLGHNCRIDEVMRKLVEKVPNKYCKNFECDKFAEDLIKKLEANNIPYEKIELKSSYLKMVSTKLNGNAITETGYHIGIKVGGKVYDNNTLLGMKHRDWRADIFMMEDGY